MNNREVTIFFISIICFLMLIIAQEIKICQNIKKIEKLQIEIRHELYFEKFGQDVGKHNKCIEK